MSTEGYDFESEFKQKYMSYQRPPPQFVPEQMSISLQSYPPLGQVTPINAGEITFTAALDVLQQSNESKWEVAVWYSLDKAEWAETVLALVTTGPGPQTIQALPQSLSRSYFTCSFRIAKSLQFTLKFREGTERPWKWIHDERGLGDGSVLVQPSSLNSEPLRHLIPDLNSEWRVSPLTSHASRSRLWSLEKIILQANDDKSAIEQAEIGTPWGSYLRWFALVRIWSPWLAPRQGGPPFSLDHDAILCSFMSPCGDNLVFLAFHGPESSLSTFRHNTEGGISVQARNDEVTESKAVVLVSQSLDFEEAVSTVMYYAKAHLTPDACINGQKPDTETRGVHATWKENWYDGLGYCTWNALGQHLTEVKVLNAVQTLAEHDIKITNLIIDDNWQAIDYKGESPFQYGWVEFEAERKAFPNGLKGLVSRIREKYPDIQHIAVWHALLGYWGGISPGGKIAKTYKTVEVMSDESKRRNLPLGGSRTVVAEEDVEQFYEDFYRFLSDAGIDGVKTDAQFVIDTWASASARRTLIKKYLDTWAAASFRHFGVKAISCMSQIPQALFHPQTPPDRSPLVMRNSDDFFPEVPASHPWHVWTNAHNTILTQYLNVLPDWDMFQTVHDYSGFHAAARCVSGGPIYVTDVPGKHDMKLIEQMTSITTEGKTVILRPSSLGRSINPYVGYDDDVLLKVGGHHSYSRFNVGILGIFNISAQPLTELIPLSCFPGLEPLTDYVIRAHSSGKVSTPTRCGDPGSLLAISLGTRGHELLHAFPLSPFTGKKRPSGWVSNLGLLGKMTGCAALMSGSVRQDQRGRVTLSTRLKALGILGVYISTPASRIGKDGIAATIHGHPVPERLITVSETDRCVFEVDLQSAYREMDLGDASGSEMEVCVFFDA
ncbi:hypothetical protein HIM_09083 [Hirsutella minnesotensis 3608]|uniref:Uncharacterized protein n=1 Tax=Hirsutella minnesotensis 3608 TaxID=1043627 RepID=A0A0F7ZLX6_9HYPO|nr:hypothetical protein HIM_09083 [Hirsutella minnesotensis 3608]